MFTFYYVIKNFLSPIVQPKINKTITILRGTKVISILFHIQLAPLINSNKLFFNILVVFYFRV